MSIIERLENGGATELQECRSADQAVARLIELYQSACNNIRQAAETISRNIQGKENPNTTSYYPLVAFDINHEEPKVSAATSWGFCRRGAGPYASTVTRPEHFADYLRENIRKVMSAHGTRPIVGFSTTAIPACFAMEASSIPPNCQHLFPGPDLQKIIGDRNGEFECLPLGQFTALQTDYRLSRLPHYTGTIVSDFQRLVLLTNYASYMESFRSWATDKQRYDEGYTEFVEPPPLDENSAIKHPPSMPAYHLKRDDGLGITLINIGVGPSNAWTMMDNISALRPHAVIMVGHCAGLRSTQKRGRLILAEGFLRCDRTGEHLLPLHVPIPPIGEINSALRTAVKQVNGLDRHKVKRTLESGVIATVANRNWEISETEKNQILDARCAAVDMETATIATCGFLHRVPYGSFLCVSDLPLHGDLKAASTAKDFYNGTVAKHLAMAIRTMEILRNGNIARLHSRKLRSTNDAPFR